MEFYKKGQGKIVRRCALFTLLFLIAFGCYTLYNIPPTTSWWWTPIKTIDIPVTGRIIIRPILIPSVVLFVICGLLIVWLLNKVKVADFLIETEGELKKVSWPAKKEYLPASWVVIVIVVVMSLFLFITDKSLSWVLHRMGIGF